FQEALAFARQQPAKATDRWEFSRGYLAWSMAPVDLAASLELLKDAPSGESGRYYGNVAHQIAALKPAEAERILGLVPAQARDQYSLRVAYRMAPIDLARARRIVDGMSEPPLKAYAFGLLGSALVKSDPAAARKLMGEAYDQLDQLVESGYSSGRSVFSPFPVAVGLLREVERVDPDRLDEFVWRTLSWRRDITYGNESRVLGNHGEGDHLRLSDPVLAAFISRYDRTLARTILTPDDDETLSLGVSYAPTFFFAGLAAIDPAA